MNNILQLKGTFNSKKNTNKPGSPNLPRNQFVTSDHIGELINQLEEILIRWQKDRLIDGALVSVHYNQVVAKSNRIKAIFAYGSKIESNQSIRGSKFERIGKNINHVFTHYIDLYILSNTINQLKTVKSIIDTDYNGVIDYSIIDEMNKDKNYMHKDLMSVSTFLNLVIDCFYVKYFDVDEDVSSLDEEAIITIYKTKYKTREILKNIGIDISDSKIIDETTINLLPNQLEILKLRAPYLIAMETKDLSEITKEYIEHKDTTIVHIPKPSNEPIIGVIDTVFYEDVYFKDWVQYFNKLDENIEYDTSDCEHGTAVSSIIVDGPSINPNLDDGCGRFRVRHFGVATGKPFSSFTILKLIREIVASNTDIKVWNLSLGSVLEIHPNFISPEAAELDRIQCEYDVIFIIAGTNKPKERKGEMRLGAPADSLNSIVVNSVTKNNEPASYHRVGPVLSFFHKPDVSYYGGDKGEYIRVCTPNGEGYVSGTSFAAPWVTRKVAFLIYNLRFSREIAKALIIDSAAGWNRKDDMSHSIGYGVVPIRIEDIVNSQDDEIRFILTGVADKYETYTYDIPVPVANDKQPFFAKATLCYFPRCSRNQGVDYTDTEMDVHFGRVIESSNRIRIDTINDNIQDETGIIGLYEGPARNLYRKWDNIKHISEKIKDRKIPKKKYGIGNWGLSIKMKDRLTVKKDKEMPFGLVITLKEMNGVNRIDDFIKLCSVRGWLVNKIDIENRIDIYNKAEEEINFD